MYLHVLVRRSSVRALLLPRDPTVGQFSYMLPPKQNPQTADFIAGIKGAKEEFELSRTGSTDRSWERVAFKVGISTGSRHMLNPGSWNDRKRSVARNVLGQMREDFHRHPRQW